MEEEKTKLDKTQKLRINPNTTFETIISKLELALNHNKYSIFVTECTQIKDLFCLINKKLSSHLLLNELTISFDQVEQLNFEETIYQLDALKQLTNLSLEFNYNSTFFLNQNKPLSACLLQFENLSHIKIVLSYELLKSSENAFSLLEFYQQAHQLTSIDYQISQAPERSLIYYNLLEGIKFLKKLNSISIVANLSKVKSYAIIDILEEELKENHQIKQLKLEFGRKTIVTNHDFCKIGNILKTQQNLEKFSLLAFSSIKQQIWTNIGLEKDILSLKNLKELNLVFECDLYFLYDDLIKAISSMDQLDNVMLDMYFSNYQQVKLSELSLQLSKIKNLTKLSISFGYDLRINAVDSILFIIDLHPLKNLKSLSISINSMNQNKNQLNNQEYDIQKLTDVINRLSSFKFKKHGELYNKEDSDINQIIKFVCNATNLEEINLELKTYFDNESCGQQTLELCDFLQKSEKLKQIDLSFGKHLVLHQSQIQTLFKSISNKSQVIDFHIFIENQLKLNQQDLQELGDCLIKQKELCTLNLQFTHDVELCEEGIIYFSDQFNQYISLVNLTLEFSKYNIPFNALICLITNIQYLKQLRQLSLKITGREFSSIEEQKSFGDSFVFQNKISSISIDLDIPGLQFNCLQNIFQQIRNLRKIENLKLNFRFQTTLEDCIQIEEYFSNLKLLKTLEFNCFSFHMLYLVRLLSKLPLLQNIDFVNDYKEICCTVNATQKIIENKKNQEMRKKTILKIQDENFFMNELYEKENASQIIPLIMQNLTHLTEMKLYFCKNNQIGENYSTMIFQNMKILSNLECLKIHIEENNLIGNKSVNKLAETLEQLPQLKQLQFILNESMNYILLKDCSLYNHTIGNLKNLEYLQIVVLFSEDQYNQDDNQTAIINLFSNVSKLTNLNTLSITTNLQLITQVVSVQFNSICQSLKNNLKFFKLSFEDSAYENPQLINQSILLLQNLQELRLNIEQRLNIQFIKNILKLKRLVSYEKIYRYEHEYDYY